jgi:hypothetical protein
MCQLGKPLQHLTLKLACVHVVEAWSKRIAYVVERITEKPEQLAVIKTGSDRISGKRRHLFLEVAIKDIQPGSVFTGQIDRHYCLKFGCGSHHLLANIAQILEIFMYINRGN